MPIRGYFAQVLPQSGLGPRLGLRPVTNDLVPAIWDQGWQAVDARLSGSASGAGQEYFVLANVSPAQHAVLIADARVTYLPTEASGGVLVLPGDPLSSISPANRTTIRSILASRHIPDDGLTGADPVSRLYRRIARVLEVDCDWLKVDALRDGLDTVISAIPVARRQRIRAALLAEGLDFDTVLLTDTIREAKLKLMAQNGN